MEPILVKDPRMILKNKREYSILKGSSETNTKIFTSTSISNSSFQFTCTPPSGNTVIDRKVYITVPIRLTFTGTGNPLLQPNRDAPRAWPFLGSIDTLKATINGLGLSINSADIIHALLHFNTMEHDSERDFSGTPNYPDQSQRYVDLVGDNRNPLGYYGDGNQWSGNPRGGFPFVVVANGNGTATVDMLVTAPIVLSPFYWGCGNGSGFINVNEMDFNLTFVTNPGFRMWSHDSIGGAGNTLTNISAQFNNFAGPAFSYPGVTQPQMLFTYLSQPVNDLYPVNYPISYPYFEIDRYISDITTTIPYGNLGTTTVISNNIQLSSIPRRMYIYVRPRNSVLYNTANQTDTYFGIQSCDIQFNNRPGLLSGASQYQLYQISAKNHLNMSWPQWSGIPVKQTGSMAVDAAANKYGTIGSILCLEFGTDIGLRDDEAPGLNGQYQLLVRLGVYNPDISLSRDDTALSLYIVTVSEGSFTIPGYSRAINQVGVISKEDIMRAQYNPFVDYDDLQMINGGGGDFLSGLKKFGKALGRSFKHTPSILKKGFEVGRQALPYVKEGVKLARDLAPLAALAAGNGGSGGVVVGGGEMSRQRLKQRLQGMRY